MNSPTVSMNEKTGAITISVPGLPDLTFADDNARNLAYEPLIGGGSFVLVGADGNAYAMRVGFPWHSTSIREGMISRLFRIESDDSVDDAYVYDAFITALINAVRA